jgi:hypothetical protein
MASRAGADSTQPCPLILVLAHMLVCWMISGRVAGLRGVLTEGGGNCSIAGLLRAWLPCLKGCYNAAFGLAGPSNGRNYLQCPYLDSANSAEGVCSLLMGKCSPMSLHHPPVCSTAFSPWSRLRSTP